MTRTDESEIQRALVRTLRLGALHSQLPGGEHEAVAPRGTGEPFLTYTMVAAPVVDDWTARMIVSDWDILVTSSDQGEANRLAALLSLELEDNLQPVTGQTILAAKKLAGLRLPEITDEDKKIYRIGGTYRIWTDQPLNTNVMLSPGDTVVTSDSM